MLVNVIILVVFFSHSQQRKEGKGDKETVALNVQCRSGDRKKMLGKWATLFDIVTGR